MHKLLLIACMSGLAGVTASLGEVVLDTRTAYFHPQQRCETD